MGISIHYSGKIADKHKLPQLIEEVQEIASVHGWEYSLYETTFPITNTQDKEQNKSTKSTHNGLLYGIDFTPNDCEPIAICFLNNGRMTSAMQLACWGNFEKESTLTVETETWDENGNHTSSTEETTIDQAEYDKLLCMCSSKTQFAGVAAHELIIGVFRYISKTYLSDFKLTDEGEFWETGDSALLHKNFERNALLIQSFSESINKENRQLGEDVESVIKRIIDDFRRKSDSENNSKHLDNEEL